MNSEPNNRINDDNHVKFSQRADTARPRTDTPHLSEAEVLEKLEQIEITEGQAKRDLMTELAWRPAWAIRSRRGTLSVLKAMFSGWKQ